MKKVKKFFSEFKDFLAKGNIVDVAIAFVLGVAFRGIISSFVEDMISPLISAAFGLENIMQLTATIGSAELRWGEFLQSVIDFLIIGFAIFILIKILSKAKSMAEKMNDKMEDAAKEIILKVKKEKNHDTKEQNEKEETVAQVKIEAVSDTSIEAVGDSEISKPVLEASKPSVEELLIEIRDLLSKNPN